MSGNHLKYMALGSVVLFGGLVLAGMPLQSALLVALVLSCPLMMVFMMFGHGGHAKHDDDARPVSDRQQGPQSDTGQTSHHH